MNWYLFVFIWVGIMYLLSTQMELTKTEYCLGKEVRRWGIFWAFVAVWPIFYLAVYEKPIADVLAYLNSYAGLPSTWQGMKNGLQSIDEEHGFYIFGCIIKILFGSDNQMYRVIIGLVHIIPVVYIFRKYSENYLLSIFIFVASGCHIGWMMNGLRQFMAVTMIFLMTPFLIKKKFIPVILMILFATTFHQSAIVMLPVVFIVQGKAWNKRTVLYIFAAIIAMTIFANVSGSFDAVLENTVYSGVEAAAKRTGDDGVHPLRVLVSFVPVLLAFIGKNEIEKDDNAFVNIAVNMSIITFGINLIAMVTSGIMVGRLPAYMDLYSVVLIPYLLKKAFVNASQQIMVLLTVGLYFLYYIMLYGFEI